MIDAAAYREEGFLLCRRLFRPEDVDAVRADAIRVFAAQMVDRQIISHAEVADVECERGMFELFERDLEVFTNCGKQAQHLISLHRLSLDQPITDALEKLGLAFPNISTRPVLYFNHPRLAKKEVYWRLGAHQDWRSMQGSLDSCVIWVALVDIDRDLGALEVVPGSHHRGLVETDLVDGYGLIDPDAAGGGYVPVEVEKGDALIFSSFLLHRSGTNVTDRIRWSCHFRYNNLAEHTFVQRGFPHPYVYQPQAELITKGFPTHEQVEGVFTARPS